MIYPEASHKRDEWILKQRPLRNQVDPLIPYAFTVEEECSSDLEVVPVATLFLTNRECPWKCLMCDLWRNTLPHTVPQGAIPAQIDYALTRLPRARQIKLYNSGSFFDHQAIPLEDYAAIANQVNSFERVIVESHPALLGERCLRFRDLLKGRLEVAIGLETAHPETLARLNKKMTLEQFDKASEWLWKNDIDLRVFILVKPPFMDEAMALHWAQRSLDFSFACHASVAVLIPTRSGNGAMDELQREDNFAPPRVETVEAAARYGISLRKGRVFIDLWDMRQDSDRWKRLREANLRQSFASL